MSVASLGGVLVVLASLASSACDRCSFRILERRNVSGTLPCCGGSARHDLTVASGTNRQVDVSNTQFPGTAGTVDLWLVPADCEQLFDGPYPGGTPRCRVLLGPIAPGAVSSRIKVDAGIYRIFVQAWSSNSESVSYIGDLGVWGNDCRRLSPTTP